MTPIKYLVCAMHRVAQDWAHAQKLEKGTYKTITEPRGLRGLHPATEIIVIDTRLRFEDYREIKAILDTRFKNVTYTTF